jgi:hypothetical protein
MCFSQLTLFALILAHHNPTIYSLPTTTILLDQNTARTPPNPLQHSHNTFPRLTSTLTSPYVHILTSTSSRPRPCKAHNRPSPVLFRCNPSQPRSSRIHVSRPAAMDAPYIAELYSSAEDFQTMRHCMFRSRGYVWHRGAEEYEQAGKSDSFSEQYQDIVKQTIFTKQCQNTNASFDLE